MCHQGRGLTSHFWLFASSFKRRDLPGLARFNGKTTCLATIKQDNLTKKYGVFLGFDLPLIAGFAKDSEG
jgi:hypothetical protein